MDATTRRNRAAAAIARGWKRRAAGSTKSSSRWSKVARGSISRLPKIYRFVRTVSSNGGGTQLVLGTDALGVQKFFVGGNNASTLQVDFALQQINIKLGGVTQITSVVPDYAEFTSLFDQWRIDKVELRIIPTYSNSFISTSTAQFLPSIIHAVDDDDSGNATNLQLQQYQTAKYTQLINPGPDIQPLRTFRPKCDVAIYKTGATFAYGSLGGGAKFIDVAYPETPHYAFKAALDPIAIAGASNTTLAALNVVAKIYFSFQTVR